MFFAELIVILCGLAALVYGWRTAQEVLAAPAGTERMQEIASAIQEGARAYLNRQYTTIAGVGLVILILLGLTLGCGWRSAISSVRCSRRPQAMSG